MNLVKFEEDYIYRNCRSITSYPDIALTELVANAWDAGAMRVGITVLQGSDNNKVCIEDNGCGMTRDEFYDRWMTLNYNREKHQGRIVEFPSDVITANKRIAYGRNGVGRHGMLCFSDRYTIETWKDGVGWRFVIAVSSGDSPFIIVNEQSFSKNGHGTIISASVVKNGIDIDSVKEILSARFVFDPQFVLTVNGNVLDLSTNTDVIRRESVTTLSGITLDIAIVDATKTAKISKRHGIAFWIGGRLVGNPSWSFGKYQFLDARYKIAKRYTVIVQSNDERIMIDVLPDWTGFMDSYIMNEVYETVDDVVKRLVSDVMSERICELKTDVIEEKRDSLSPLSIAEKREVSEFMDHMTKDNPLIASESLSASVDALISVQNAKRGKELLNILSEMSPEELDNLATLLSNWDINDIVSVIDEIDNRIIVIEAISRIYDNEETDELHTLHPMVLKSKWLFGAEFDSPMFTSNKALSTVVRSLFRDDEFDVNEIANPRRRPDIFCLSKSTIRVVCTEKCDMQTGNIMKPDQILIIELKRGGYEIGYPEVNQVNDYIHQIKKSMILHKDSSIHAFVVGAKIGDINPHFATDEGVVDVVTYGHLVQTAKVKLFGLKERLEDHYNSIDDKSLVERALAQPRQMSLFES